MSIPMEDMERVKEEIASSNDNQNKEQKITDIGYLYLSQQINNLMQMLNEFRNNTEIRFDNQRQEFKNEIKALSDKTDARFAEMRKETNARFNGVDKKFDRVDTKFDNVYSEIKEVRKEISSLQRWSFAILISVVLGFVAIYFK